MTPAFRIFLAAVLGVVAVAAAEEASTYQTGAQWLAVVLLGAAFFVALCTAGTAIAAATWGMVYAAVYEWRLARRIPPPPSSGRHAGARAFKPPPLLSLPPLDPRTVARDAVIADSWRYRYQVEAVNESPRDGATVPMPIVVVDAQPWPWSAPVARIGGNR